MVCGRKQNKTNGKTMEDLEMVCGGQDRTRKPVGDWGDTWGGCVKEERAKRPLGRIKKKKK